MEWLSTKTGFLTLLKKVEASWQTNPFQDPTLNSGSERRDQKLNFFLTQSLLFPILLHLLRPTPTQLDDVHQSIKARVFKRRCWLSSINSKQPATHTTSFNYQVCYLCWAWSFPRHPLWRERRRSKLWARSISRFQRGLAYNWQFRIGTKGWVGIDLWICCDWFEFGDGKQKKSMGKKHCIGLKMVGLVF